METESSIETRTGNAGRKRKSSLPEVDVMLRFLSEQPDATREEPGGQAC